MNSYIDKYGRYHHKPVTNNNLIPSNNGWIYTAYAKKLNISLDADSLSQCFEQCLESKDGRSVLYRHPISEQNSVPISRDEILGMAALDLLKPHHLNKWNFSPFPLPKFNILKTLCQFWQIRDKHRNYFWQNNLSHVYRFAFSVPISDRHFILNKWGKFNIFYFLVHKVSSLLDGKTGLDWLKYNSDIDLMKKEFPFDHPFNSEEK
jgi:hypothetical protein